MAPPGPGTSPASPRDTRCRCRAPGRHGPRSEEHTSELQSLSLHDALPIFLADVAVVDVEWRHPGLVRAQHPLEILVAVVERQGDMVLDRKSTRLNSSHFPYTTLFRSSSPT